MSAPGTETSFRKTMAEPASMVPHRLSRALACLQAARQRATLGDHRYARLNAEQTLLCLLPLTDGLNFASRYRQEAQAIIKTALTHVGKDKGTGI